MVAVFYHGFYYQIHVQEYNLDCFNSEREKKATLPFRRQHICRKQHRPICGDHWTLPGPKFEQVMHAHSWGEGGRESIFPSLKRHSSCPPLPRRGAVTRQIKAHRGCGLQGDSPGVGWWQGLKQDCWAGLMLLCDHLPPLPQQALSYKTSQKQIE